ncbi:MAG: copper chaperone PCu(A)C [Paracoccus sp. (in: a-proteobacteria)]|uniref:copper chaperone PCu(A)C n=1 Tax=Paracoccus sp. TaxID=267 RepID=UPI00391A24D8
MKKIAFVAAMAALTPLAALAHDGMHINDAYARSTNPMTGAIFMELENHREVGCTLQAVASDVAERVELHTHKEEDGVMRMLKVEEGFAVPAGEVRQLDRGGDHVMLLGLTRPLADGDTIALSLDFGDCGTEEAEAVVDNQRMGGAHDAGGAAAADEHAGH